MIISKKMLIVFLQVPIDLDLQFLCGPLEEFLSIRKLYMLYFAKWDTFSSSSACMNIECWDLAPLNQRLRLFDGTFLFPTSSMMRPFVSLHRLISLFFLALLKRKHLFILFYSILFK